MYEVQRAHGHGQAPQPVQQPELEPRVRLEVQIRSRPISRDYRRDHRSIRIRIRFRNSATSPEWIDFDQMYVKYNVSMAMAKLYNLSNNPNLDHV